MFAFGFPFAKSDAAYADTISPAGPPEFRHLNTKMLPASVVGETVTLIGDLQFVEEPSTVVLPFIMTATWSSQVV